MEFFDNKTKNGNEQAIKVGRVVPEDAANVAFYRQEPITASSSLSVIDISEKIKENNIEKDSNTVFMFSNEIGILEDINRKQ